MDIPIIKYPVIYNPTDVLISENTSFKSKNAHFKSKSTVFDQNRQMRKNRTTRVQERVLGAGTFDNDGSPVLKNVAHQDKEI